MVCFHPLNKKNSPIDKVLETRRLTKRVLARQQFGGVESVETDGAAQQFVNVLGWVAHSGALTLGHPAWSGVIYQG